MRSMTMILVCIASAPCLAYASASDAGDDAQDKARKELEPRPVNLAGKAMSLSEAIKALQQQTGNTIVDRRENSRDDPQLKLDLKGVTFWQAIDDITARAGCNYSLYHEEGALALIDGTPRKPNAAYAGICRLAVKRVRVDREEDSGLSYCSVHAELAWEPRFQPFYFDVHDIEAHFAAPGGRGKPSVVKSKGSGLTHLDGGGGAVEFDMRLPAPPRVCPSIETLSAQIKLIGPSKMLTFRVSDLKASETGVEQIQEGVKVTIRPYAPKRKEWSFDVIINNPPGAFQFDSHQMKHWLIHNRIYLENDLDKSRITHEPDPDEPLANLSFKHAAFRFDFRGDDLPLKIDGWTLVYRTPGRVVDLGPLNFTLKNIALP